MGLTKPDWKKSVLWLGIAIAATVLMTIPRQCSGKNVSSMYREEVLSRLQKRYSDNISWNFEHVIKPVLTKKELAALQDVRLEYPLIGEGGDPFRYFVRVEGKRRTIVMPIFSVKFLDGLATAAAWMRHNDLTTETLPEYIAMLKYQGASKFEGGRYPTPLEALHIPDKPLDNPKVDETAQDLLKTTVVYILSREVGSIYFSRPYTLRKASWSEQRQRPQQVAMKEWGRHSEQQDLMLKSDSFALEIMRRIGVPPHNLSFYLSAQTYWTQNRIDFRNEKAYLRYQYNPPECAMFPERLHRMSDLMVRGKEDYARQQDDKLTSTSQIEQAAREIFKLSYFLENQSMQWEIKQRALARKIEDLKPRRR